MDHAFAPRSRPRRKRAAFAFAIVDSASAAAVCVGAGLLAGGLAPAAGQTRTWKLGYPG